MRQQINFDRLSPFIGVWALALWLALCGPPAHAIVSTYNGVSVQWEAGLSDLELVETAGNILRYQTRQLHPRATRCPSASLYPRHMRNKMRCPP
jgi:hypothetical protein